MSFKREKIFIRTATTFAGVSFACFGLDSENLINKLVGVGFGILVTALGFIVTKDIDSVSPKQ